MKKKFKKNINKKMLKIKQDFCFKKKLIKIIIKITKSLCNHNKTQ